MPSILNTRLVKTGLSATKVCSKCGVEKPLTEFQKNKKNPDGLRSECSLCNAEMYRRWSQRNPYKRMLKGAKERAAKKGLLFNLTEEDLKELDSGVCPYLGIPTKFYDFGRGTGNRPYDLKSLDRIDSAGGYTVDNVVICSWIANAMLSNFTARDISNIPDLKPIADRFFTLLNPSTIK